MQGSNAARRANGSAAKSLGRVVEYGETLPVTCHIPILPYSSLCTAVQRHGMSAADTHSVGNRLLHPQGPYRQGFEVCWFAGARDQLGEHFANQRRGSPVSVGRPPSRGKIRQ